jgi:IS4 transposase
MATPAPVLREFESLSLGDRRLDRRLLRMVEQLATAPNKSFPEAMRPSDCEGAYRFFANAAVGYEDILAPHVAATLRRVKDQRFIRVVHDTTALSFSGKRSGLGSVGRESEGFYAHVSLAVGPGDERAALGAVAVFPYVEKRTQKRKGLGPSERVALIRSKPRKARHSSRWEKLAIRVKEMLPDDFQAIHVMDREADDFTLLTELHHHHVRFVVRGSGNRLTAEAGQKLRDLLSQRVGEVFRTVKVNRRSKNSASRQYRTERMAELKIRWAQATLPRPPYATDAAADELRLWVVHVFEENAPGGEDPTEWVLLTSEPVRSLGDAALVVDHYRARWVIEEFFKALKTGCAVERRQLTTYDALLRAMALLVPMAWHLLALRQMSRLERPPRAKVLFDREQLKLLEALYAERRKRHRFPKNPTVRDAMLALAAVGGHLTQNGDPGWLVLGRGYETLAAAEVGWRLAKQAGQK